MSTNKFGIGDRVHVIQETSVGLQVSAKSEVIGIYSDVANCVQYSLEGRSNDVNEADCIASIAELMDRVRKFAEPNGENGQNRVVEAGVETET